MVSQHGMHAKYVQRWTQNKKTWNNWIGVPHTYVHTWNTDRDNTDYDNE